MRPEDQPDALITPAETQRRIALLNQPHIVPLGKYLAEIKSQHPDKDLPAFDPCDGGVLAKALFLLEAPGPKARDSTFISRNNLDPTARNMCRLLQEAGIPRCETLLWNIVPWYVGDGIRIRAVNNDDIREASIYLEDLLGLLPNLKVIVLVGKKAQSAKGQIGQLTRVPIIDTPHPSATAFNVRPHKEDEMRERLQCVAAIMQGENIIRDEDAELLYPSGRYRPECPRQFENLALRVLRTMRKMKNLEIDRTQDVIQISAYGETGIAVLVSLEAIEIRLAHIEWTCGAYGPAISSLLWQRLEAEAVEKMSDVELLKLFTNALHERQNQQRNCPYCKRRFVPERCVEGNVCHGCAEKHLHVVF